MMLHGSEVDINGEEAKMTGEETKAPRAPRRPKTIQIKVSLLDNTLYECELEVRAVFIFIFYLLSSPRNEINMYLNLYF